MSRDEHRFPRTPGTVPAETPAVPAVLDTVPASTRQVIRVLASRRWCAAAHCAQLELWQRAEGVGWQQAPVHDRGLVERVQVGAQGFAAAGAKRELDRRTPTGVFGIVTTFSTDPTNPGTAMPWRQRKPTSVVPWWPGPTYNAWMEVPSWTDGDRPQARYGLWVSYNNARLCAEQQPAPAARKGSGIFLHVPVPKDPLGPTEGCVAVPVPTMKWLLGWLDPAAAPRIVLGL